MKNIDDFMRQKFDTDDPAGRFEFREEYWEQAQAMLEAEEARRRKRRRWLLWWLCSVAVVAVAVAVYSGSRQEQSAVGSSSERERVLNERSAGSEVVQAQSDTATSGFIFKEKTPDANSDFLKNKIENQRFETKTGETGNRFSTEQPAQKGGETPTNKPQAARLEINPPPLPLPPSTPKNDLNYLNDFNDPNNLNDFNDFASLPTLLQMLQLPPRALGKPYIIMEPREIKPVRERQFQFGLTASASLSQTSPDGKRWGGVGGAFAEYRLAPAWVLTAGFQWRYLPGDWRADSAIVETSSQLRYGFGFQQNEYSMETRGLHFLEIPVGLQWRRGAFGVEAGVAPGFLVGVQGRLTQRHSESLQNGISETSNRVWLDKSPYRSAYLAPFLGAEWRVTQRLGLSLRGVFHPGSFAKENVDAPPSGNLFWLDAGLRFRF